MNEPRPDELLAEIERVGRELGPPERLAVIEHLISAGEPAPATPFDGERLGSAYKSFTQRHEFSTGQIVQWKPGLRNKVLPEYGQPAIVHSVLEEAIINEAEPADSPYFRESLDIVLGVIDGTGDLLFFHFDARRFEPAA